MVFADEDSLAACSCHAIQAFVISSRRDWRSVKEKVILTVNFLHLSSIFRECQRVVCQFFAKCWLWDVRFIALLTVSPTSAFILAASVLFPHKTSLSKTVMMISIFSGALLIVSAIGGLAYIHAYAALIMKIVLQLIFLSMWRGASIMIKTTANKGTSEAHNCLAQFAARVLDTKVGYFTIPLPATQDKAALQPSPQGQPQPQPTSQAKNSIQKPTSPEPMILSAPFPFNDAELEAADQYHDLVDLLHDQIEKYATSGSDHSDAAQCYGSSYWLRRL